MALIDFALVNANIHYHMAFPDLKSHKEHHVRFMQELATNMCSTNWHQLQTNHQH